MIAGLETPTEGDILVDGNRINDLEPKDRDVAMVFLVNYGRTRPCVYENIRFPLKVRGVPKAEREEMVQRAAAMVNWVTCSTVCPKRAVRWTASTCCAPRARGCPEATNLSDGGAAIQRIQAAGVDLRADQKSPA